MTRKRVWQNRRTGEITIYNGGETECFDGRERVDAFKRIKELFGKALGYQIMERLVRERIR